MNYDREGDALIHDRPVGEGTFRLRAEAIHQERTGVHARIAIMYQGTALAWSTFNIERDEDRLRLTNSAHKHLNGQARDYPSAYLKQDLDDFCYGLWGAKLGDMEAELMAGSAEPRATQFVLEPYVVEEGGTILFAHPGRGKSYLALLMAVSIDAGADIPYERRLWAVRPRRVLFINLERGRTRNEDRLGNVNAALGLPRSRPLLTMNQRGKSLSDVLDMARRMVRQHQIGWVLLDSISRAGLGDLNENSPVNKIIDALNGLIPSWTGIAHAPRASDEHLYGSIHFEAGADVVVRLLKEQQPDGPLGLRLEITKENDVGARKPEQIALEFGPLGLTGVRRAHKGEFPDLDRGKGPSMKQVVTDYLLGIGDATATDAAKATGFSRQNISELFAVDPAFVKTRTAARSQYYGVRAPTPIR